ncbi:MAG TPA: DUF1549 and DUF1553 domain-containing protein [Pirellulales bacterium]|nr:DUF1549 and DUF1553 domain-containing protein [Pirellulales bacterium]
MPRPPSVLPGCLILLAVAAGQSRAEDAVDRSAAFVEVSVNPAEVRLAGHDARFSLLVDGRDEAGRLLDLTHSAQYRSLSPELVVVSPAGVVRGLADGNAIVEVEAAGCKRQVTCTVEGSRRQRLYNFANDVVPLLSKFGCNSSGCHGKAEGQNGFKLSVFGFDPAADYQALTMQDRGRRVFPAAAEQSLLLRKATGSAPHGGGARLAADSREYRILVAWIAGGLRFGDSSDPRVIGIVVEPRERVLGMRSRQQLRVVARYSDGSEADVTGLARFQSNQEGLAAVDEMGLVTTGEAPGQAAVMASFMGEVDLFTAIIPRSQPIDASAALAAGNFIDQLVGARLAKLNIAPSRPASDAEFLRRVFLDTIGTLPSSDEARRFLADPRPDKRARLVDELLQRPEFADYWALKWADLLRVDRAALGHEGAYAYYHWIRRSIAENMPLDRFARELLTAEGPLGESPQGYFYKAVQKPGEMASTLSQVFLGVRIACAECHHHPFDRWSQTDYYGMVDFFAPLNRKASPRGEMILAAGNPTTTHPRTGESVWAHGLGAPTPEHELTGDRRRALADWLASPQNPWFARNLANRIWAHYTGRGLVEPLDDVRATNPPTNPELLDALANYLVERRFDVRELVRAITASRVYQLSTEPNETNARDEQNFSRALFKPLPAEVLLDAVCQTTGMGEKFPGLPSGYRAIQLWDSGVQHYFLRLFGRPGRQTACECERNVGPSVAQVLHFLNSPEIEAKLNHEAGRIKRLADSIADDGALADELYLTIFSRWPDAQERRDAVDNLSKSDSRRQAAEDQAWAMLNSLEFIFNH